MQPVRVVACPHCNAPARFAPDNPWRPFCSERCKLIDLGAWASERYRVTQAQADAGVPADDEPPRD